MAPNWHCCPHCQTFFFQPDNDPTPTACPACRKGLSGAPASSGQGEWHYVENKKKVGPVGFARLQELAAAGSLRPGDMVLEQGTAKWKSAGEVPGLFPAPQAPIAEPAPSPPPPAEPASANEPPEWSYLDDNNQLVGPVGLARLRELVAAGQMRRSYMLQPKGSTRWVPAMTIEGLFSAEAPTALPPAAPAPVPAASAPVPVPEKPEWYYIANRRKTGPADLQQIKELLQSGQLRGKDMVLPKGAEKWVAVETVAEFLPLPSPAPEPLVVPPAAPVEPVPVVESPPEPPPPESKPAPEPASEVPAPPSEPTPPMAVEAPPMAETPATVPEAVAPPPPAPAPPPPPPAIPRVVIAPALPPQETPKPTTAGPAILASERQVVVPSPEPPAPVPVAQSPRLESPWSAAEVVQRFRLAWWHGKRPELDEFLPSRPEVRQAALPEMTRIDLECRLNCKEPVRVESYLERYAELGQDRNAVLDLLTLEYRHRRRGQPELPIDEYARRFPQYGPELTARLQEALPAVLPSPPKPSEAPAGKPPVPVETSPPPAEAVVPAREEPAKPGVLRPEEGGVSGFARREPVAAAIAAGVALLLFIAFATTYDKYRSAKQQQGAAERAAAGAAQREREALEEVAQARKAKENAEQEAAAARLAENTARAEAQKAREAEKAARENELKALEREKIARESAVKAAADEKKALEEAIRARTALEQSGPAWHRQYAEQWEKAGQWTAAAYHLGRLIELNPRDEKLLVRRAEAYRQQGEWLLAAADCSRALELKSDLPLRSLRDEFLARSLQARVAAAAGIATAGPLAVPPALLPLPGTAK
jgi:tetratricopeptide (TPR) repeat protein